MAYDENTATRVRAALKARRGVTEKKMFGGVAFLVDGKMCCGVLKRDLVLRLGAADGADALRQRHVRPMDFTGQAMKSFVYVSPAGYASTAALREWVERAVAFARTQPVGKKRKKK